MASIVISNPRPTGWRVESAGIGTTLPFEAIHAPGCYVSHGTGHPMRIPQDGVKYAISPVMEIRGFTPLFVTKISDDPYLSLSKAREVAADLDLTVDF